MDVGGMQAWDDEVLLATSDEDESFDNPTGSIPIEPETLHHHTQSDSQQQQHSSSSMTPEQPGSTPAQEQGTEAAARALGMSSHPLVGSEESAEPSIGSEGGEAEDMVIVEEEGAGAGVTQGSPPAASGVGPLGEAEGTASPYNDHNYWNKSTYGQVPDEP